MGFNFDTGYSCLQRDLAFSREIRLNEALRVGASLCLIYKMLVSSGGLLWEPSIDN